MIKLNRGMTKLKEIKDIVEDIREELDGAKHYAEKAVRFKGMDSARMNAYADMARQELAHVDNLHKMAVKLIEAQRASGASVPASMQVVWDWEHENMMDKAARIRMLLEMAK